MFLPSFLPPHLTYKHVTCCPCVVWNNWATAAKASELGNCGIVGTELAVTWGGSEVTFAGGGGEPKISIGMDKKLHYSKNCTNQCIHLPPWNTCLSTVAYLNQKKKNQFHTPIWNTPIAYFIHFAFNCSIHCSYLCTGHTKKINLKRKENEKKEKERRQAYLKASPSLYFRWQLDAYIFTIGGKLRAKLLLKTALSNTHQYT